MTSFHARLNQSYTGRLVVFTDLDGILVEHTVCSFHDERPALAQLDRAGVPLVLCSNKTRAEIEPLRLAFESDAPFISENGGAVFVPINYFSSVLDLEDGERRGQYIVYQLGAPYRDVVATLAEASFESRTRVRGFADMSDEDVALATGLPIELARYARQRECDEPFEILDPGGADALLAAIAQRGRRWSVSGRFYHITGADKGTAVRWLANLYRSQMHEVTTVGIGEAPDDADLLRAVDLPIVLASSHAPALRRLVPNARETRVPGLRGWNEAILELLDASE